MRGGRARSAWALVALLAGCGPRVTEVPLDDLEFELLFLITADASVERLRLAETTARAGEPGALPGAVLAGHEERFFLIALSREALDAAMPGRITGPEAKVILRLERPPPRPTYQSTAGEEVQDLALALPPGTEIFTGPARADGAVDTGALERVTLASSLLADKVTLVARIDSEHCRRPSQSGLTPFAADEAPLAQAEPTAQLQDMEWLDARRVLLSTALQVVVIERGAPYVPTERPLGPGGGGNWLSLLDFGPVPPGELIRGIVVLPPGPDGARAVFVHGGVLTGPGAPPEGYGWIRRARWTPAGIEWVPEPRLLVTHGVTAGLPDGDGVLFGLEDNYLARWSPTNTATVTFEHRFASRNPPEDQIFAIERTPDPAFPLLASTRGAIHTFTATPAGWSTREVEQTRILAPELYKPYALAAVLGPQGHLQTWVATQIGDVLWRAELPLDFSALKPAYPPRFTPCSSASTDGTLAYERRDVADVALQDGYALLTYSDCSALVQIRQAEPDGAQPHCVTLIPPAGEVPTHLDDARDFRHRVITRPGMAVVGTSRGGLYITEW
jgi:hypothetical protein